MCKTTVNPFKNMSYLKNLKTPKPILGKVLYMIKKSILNKNFR